MQELILAGDSRVADYEWHSRTHRHWDVRVIPRIGTELEPLLEKVNRNIKPNTKIVVICAIHCDLSYRVLHEDGYAGLMHAHTNPPVNDLACVMSTWDYQWRVGRNLTVCWVMPVVPDFVLYNRLKSEDFECAEFCPLHIEQAKASERIFKEATESLLEKVEKEGLHIVELSKVEEAIQNPVRYDGLHMASETKQMAMKSVCYQAIAMHPMAKPRIVANVKTASARIQARAHKWRQMYRKEVKALVAAQITTGDSCARVGVPIVQSKIQQIQPDPYAASASHMSMQSCFSPQQNYQGHHCDCRVAANSSLNSCHSSKAEEPLAGGSKITRRTNEGRVAKPGSPRYSVKERLGYSRKRHY